MLSLLPRTEGTAKGRILGSEGRFHGSEAGGGSWNPWTERRRQKHPPEDFEPDHGTNHRTDPFEWSGGQSAGGGDWISPGTDGSREHLPEWRNSRDEER